MLSGMSSATLFVFPTQVSREANSGAGYDWSVSFLTDVEPSATSSRLVVSYNGVSGTGAISALVSVACGTSHIVRRDTCAFDGAACLLGPSRRSTRAFFARCFRFLLTLSSLVFDLSCLIVL